MHGVAVGIDVAKDFLWVQAVDRRDSEVGFGGRVDNTLPALGAFVEQLEVLRARGPVTVGVDVVGGIAGVLLGRYVTQAEIRQHGRRRLVQHILRAGRIARRHADDLADHAVAAAREQTITVAGERVAGDLVRELAVEAAHTAAGCALWTAICRPRSSAPLRRPSSKACRGWGPPWPPSSSPRQAASSASPPPTSSPPPPAWRLCSSSRARSATSNAPTAAIRRSSASSSNQPSAR